jgi:hypothetical protein
MFERLLLVAGVYSTRGIILPVTPSSPMAHTSEFRTPVHSPCHLPLSICLLSVLHQKRHLIRLLLTRQMKAPLLIFGYPQGMKQASREVQVRKKKSSSGRVGGSHLSSRPCSRDMSCSQVHPTVLKVVHDQNSTLCCIAHGCKPPRVRIVLRSPGYTPI